MNSSSNMYATALPHGASYWDRLPNELKEMVFKHASPLTLFLNGRLELESKGNEERIRSLWMEAFDDDWQGDLQLLPAFYKYYPSSCLKNADFTKVKSRSMYERLCARFPEFTETDDKFALYDELVERFRQLHSTYIRVEPGFMSTPLRLLHIPMRHMWLDLLDDMINKYPHACVRDCILEGHTDLLRHMVDIGKIDLRHIHLTLPGQYKRMDMHYAIDVAAERGHLDIIKMIRAAGCDNATTKAMTMAAAHGHLEVIKWLHENRKEGCTNRAIDWAAMNGHLDVVKWLHENRTEGCTVAAMDLAARYGHLDAVKWLHENRTEGCTSKAMDNAAGRGHLDIVKWFHENRTEGCTTYAMDKAAARGHFDVVKWLHENRNEGCTKDAMYYATRNGHLDVVKFLHENRTEGCTFHAMDDAAKHGHLDVVKFLLENRTEGFTDTAIRFCGTTEIAEVLIAIIPAEQRRLMLQKSSHRKWSVPGVRALRKSLEDHDLHQQVV